MNQYFDDIEGEKLDDQQRTAVITDEYSNLIIAGAGSVKTLIILAKVKYLLEKKCKT
ncbi:MAG: UvrD-helicase domain-containing protein [Winogradskyella sp.]|nr:UvrD-helicase domain-containing protein [Winogradskyella sp.]NRB84882.1 UvrD-helicase domain-containing protein [Winogradskyella sp.]